MRFVNCVVLFAVLMLACLVSASAQAAAECPSGMVCISQAAANKAAENARELEATKAKVAVLEQALADKDKNAEELRSAAARNEADLKDALRRTEVQLAEKTGQLIKAESQIVQQSAIIQFMLQHGRKKCGVLSICIQ